jgi:hypothetical protein
MARRRRLLGSSHFARAIVTGLLLLPSLVSFAQQVTEPALKAAFILKFARLTEWPIDALPAGAPLVMCVLGDPDIADALERLVQGRDTAGHSFTVSRVAAHAPLRACHILYLSHVPAKEAAQITAGLRDAPVLTISDMEGFGALGGIAQFYYERGNLKFSVEVETSKHARLAISSLVLTLSKRP